MIRGVLIFVAMTIGTPAVAQGFTTEETSTTAGSYVEYRGSFEGVKYSYLLDPSGQVANGSIDGPLPSDGLAMDDADRWVVTADRDKMSDTVRWYAHHYKTGLMMGLTSNGGIRSVCLVGADFPNRPIAVRVGRAAALRFAADCSTSHVAILKTQLLAGGHLLTRGYKWPYDYPQDREGVADNFGKLLKLYDYLRSRTQ